MTPPEFVIQTAASVVAAEPDIQPSTDGATKVTLTIHQLNDWSTMWDDMFHKDPVIACLVVFVLLDIISGLVAAIKLGKMSSKASYRGMMSKAQMFLVVTAAKFSEYLISGGPWGNIVAGFFCLTEIISITENAGMAGVPIPKSWMDALQKFRLEEAKPLATVDVHTVIHTEKKDVDVVTSQAVIPGLVPRQDKTPSDQIQTVVKMTDSQILSHEELTDPPPAVPKQPPTFGSGGSIHS